MCYNNGSSNTIHSVSIYEEFILLNFCGGNFDDYYLQYSDNMTISLTIKEKFYNLVGKNQLISFLENFLYEGGCPSVRYVGEMITARFIHDNSRLLISMIYKNIKETYTINYVIESSIILNTLNQIVDLKFKLWTYATVPYPQNAS